MEETIITPGAAPEIEIAVEDPIEGVEETIVPVVTVVEDADSPKDLKIAVGESLGIGERVG